MKNETNIFNIVYYFIRYQYKILVFNKEKNKKKLLSKSDKSRNKFLSFIRIPIENVFYKIKTFKVLP